MTLRNWGINEQPNKNHNNLKVNHRIHFDCTTADISLEHYYYYLAFSLVTPFKLLINIIIVRP